MKSVSQSSLHHRFGGVVPEVASREHFLSLDSLVQELLSSVSKDKVEIAQVAATTGPGLVGPLLVGASYAEGLASGWGVPFRRIHHLRGHVASALLSLGTQATLLEKAKSTFPALILLVSGGHTQVLYCDRNLKMKKLADTADDSAGECFDKSAKLMGLPYPGGPAIERLSVVSAEAKSLLAELPVPRSAEGFSFSGLKTAIRLMIEKKPELKATPQMCWAIQECILKSLLKGLNTALEKLDADADITSFVFCGGVSANERIRGELELWAQKQRLQVVLPPLKYCGDNAAMIAAAAWIQDSKFDLKEVLPRVSLEDAV